MSESTLHNWQEFANAIILRAVEDYRNANARNRLRPHQTETMREVRSIEQFFCSEWFEVLCNLDGKRLLSDLKKDMEDAR